MVESHGWAVRMYAKVVQLSFASLWLLCQRMVWGQAVCVVGAGGGWRRAMALPAPFLHVAIQLPLTIVCLGWHQGPWSQAVSVVRVGM